ncbi:MAG: DinB family protein [Acidimicrobiales bacterium]
MTEPRVDPAFDLHERAMLDAFLDWYRATVFQKCEGLRAGQLAERSAPPSILSLIGIVRHLAEVERWWFRMVFGGQPELGEIYCTDDNLEADLEAVDADPDADLATLRAEIELARAATAGHDLDEFGHDPRGADMNLRWIYVHMIEEYARHVGHMDLLRERIDGATGD